MRANLIVTAACLGAGLISCAKKDSKEDTQLAAISTSVTSIAELPGCSTETISQVYWVEEQGKLVVCDGSQFVDIKGEKGDTGSAGPAGSAANSGVWVFDKDSKPVGVLIGSSGLMLFSNGAVARINLATGAYSSAEAISTSGGMVDVFAENSVVCNYVETDCSGTCYQMNASVIGTVKGSIYKSSTSFVVATGKEDLVTGLTSNSTYFGGSCIALGGGAFAMDAFPITKPYSFPEGITLPLKTPLTFGMKTEQ